MRAGLIQMCSGIDPVKNVLDAERLIREAAALGAEFVATPETTHLVQKDADALFETICKPEEDPAIAYFGSLAKSLGITLLIGSMALKIAERRAVNRSILFDASGEVAATYDKIHMFDVGLGAGETYSESTNYQPGERVVLTNAGPARLGLTICYDVRFASLYRRLARAGAQIIAVPSAFTRPTGKAHWEVLLRARAIETGCFVMAPAQGGLHEDGRKTWGHSLIINPWGEIIGRRADDAPGIIVTDIDLSKVDDVRSRIPSLALDRQVTGP